mgnify:CR=1 FL=1
MSEGNPTWWSQVDNSCSDQGINQVYGACVFAALATLWYRVPRLYQLMDKDIQEWVDEQCKNRFALQDVEDLSCPALPKKFWKSYSTFTKKETIYDGNNSVLAMWHFLSYSSVNFWMTRPQDVLNPDQIWGAQSSHIRPVLMEVGDPCLIPLTHKLCDD